MLCVSLLLVPGCSAPGVESLKGDPLNPDAFRPQIILIDAVVFDVDDTDEITLDQVANAMVVLAGAAEADPGNALAMALAPELRALIAQVKRT